MPETYGAEPEDAAPRLPKAPAASSPAVRAVMRGNRKTGTRPELALRRALHARGMRYRVNHPLVLPDLRVRPDVVFTRRRIAVFLDGCYWHGCPQHGTAARTNGDYWRAKIARNQARDVRIDAGLRAAGWMVVRAWEHEPPEEVADRVARLLQAGL